MIEHFKIVIEKPTIEWGSDKYTLPKATIQFSKEDGVCTTPKVIETYTHPLLPQISKPDQEILILDPSEDPRTLMRQAVGALLLDDKAHFLPYHQISSMDDYKV